MTHAQQPEALRALAWAVVHDDDMVLTDSSGVADAWRKAGLDVLSLAPTQEQFQERVQPWMMECFGAEISADKAERNHRFLEEAIELVQACGCSASEAHQLVDYVYGRPVGEPAQEVGGTMVTLAALCLAQGLNMHQAADIELARVWTKVEAIRAKQASKPKHSPLPQAKQDVRDVIRLLMAAASDAGHLLCMTAKQQKEMRDQTVASINIALAEANKAIGGAA